MLTSGVYGYLVDYLLWCLIFASLVVHTWCFFKFFPQKRPRLRLVIGNCLVFVCLLGFAALLSETYLRFCSVKTDAFGMTLPARRWFLIHTEYNSLKCRDKEWATDKPQGMRRIAFVGDSFTFGWGIERTEDRFTDLLQARFDARNPGAVEVMNVAKPGWDTGEQIQPIRDIIARYSVDEIVLCVTPNDIEKLLPTSDGFDPTVPPQPSLFNTDSSCLVDYLYRRVYTPYARSVRNYHDWLADGYADPNLWRAQQRQFASIIRACDDDGAELRMVLLPFILTGGEKYDARTIHANIREFFELNGVQVVDLLPVLADRAVGKKKGATGSDHAELGDRDPETTVRPGRTLRGYEPSELVVNRHDPHPNEKANALFAEQIWQALYADGS